MPLKFTLKKPSNPNVLQVFYSDKYLGEIYRETHGEFVYDYYDGDARGEDLRGYCTSECLKGIANKLDELNKDQSITQ